MTETVGGPAGRHGCLPQRLAQQHAGGQVHEPHLLACILLKLPGTPPQGPGVVGPAW